MAINARRSKPNAVVLAGKQLMHGVIIMKTRKFCAVRFVRSVKIIPGGGAHR